MQKNSGTFNEKLRRAALKEYQIVNSGPDEDYDNLTFLATVTCEVSVAKINIVDRDRIWNKSVHGTEISEIEREHSFCDLTIKSKTPILCLKRSEDPEIFESATGMYSTEYSFYAGVPLYNPDGHAIAVLCIFDTYEKELSSMQEKALLAISKQALKLFESRKQKQKLFTVQNKLEEKYKELEKFASLVSHDLKSPLANIISLSELLKDENKEKFDEETNQYLQFLVEASYSLRNYIDGILSFYRSDHVIKKEASNVNLGKLLKPIVDLYTVSNNIEISYPEDIELTAVNKAALTQVFMNLISNALKYNDKDIRKVRIEFTPEEEFYTFEVIDNGNGIPAERFEKIFELFATLDTADRDGNVGSGIGLATVKKLVESMHGKVSISSTEGEGSNFKFSVPRH
ncbi:HAMP domain-containing sensor histidine kinase [uncultured Christiangramia sp.]|uniref:GAF domain-containing sensor histidine kinase n=1 Tax=uncultured Christiangramia sp. TaxID=503836 RepID=UPI0026184CFB|nr:HAMP domain-containing sensor histidine kinase [uncultured Christiangramia sp.]